jgi:hypothetical protein
MRWSFQKVPTQSPQASFPWGLSHDLSAHFANRRPAYVRAGKGLVIGREACRKPTAFTRQKYNGQ